MKVKPLEEENVIGKDWLETPMSVQQIVMTLRADNQELRAENGILRQRLELLEEQVKQNSQNSSQPPSKDGFGKKKAVEILEKKEEKRKRGGQIGHKGHERHLYEASKCEEIHEHRPEICKVCGSALSGEDEAPYRHQTVEIPPVKMQITEHRLHELECQHCRQKTRAKLPSNVSASSYGERLSALVAWFSSDYRQSHGQLQQMLNRLFGIEISRASISRLRREMSEALELVVTEAHEYVQSQPQMHSDETGFVQGNCDSNNPEKSKAWLWVLVTKYVSVFKVFLSRAKESAQEMIGETYTGIVISDRYRGYTGLDASQRQVCWAHLKRDFTAMSERCGVSEGIGLALLARQRRLFQIAVNALRQGFKTELESAAALPISYNEKSPLAKTVRTCREILKLEPSLWTFVFTNDIEPTNNAAEQALRPAVIWRRTSFGSQSASGSQFVARLMSVVASLKAQGRDIWDFLTLVFRSARFDLPLPSLLPLSP
jgi:transposase